MKVRINIVKDPRGFRITKLNHFRHLDFPVNSIETE